MLRQGLREDLALTGAPILIDCCRVLIPVSANFLSLQVVYCLDSALNVQDGRLNRTVALATSPMYIKADCRALTQELWDSSFFVFFLENCP